MAFNYKIAFLALFALVALFANSPVNGGILDDFQKGINNVLDSVSSAACVVSHKSEFDECYSKIRGAYSDIQNNKDNEKEFCCSYVAYRDCVEAVSYKHCGEKAAEIADSIMSGSKKLLATAACDQYNNILDCMDPVLRIVVIGVVIGVAIIILGCLVKVCLSCCR